mmetsp:Transcript_5863/g.19300  ORF Transcript_5863/g.19300 Transcript_5863/m.19300 type:complete len:182 (-) Transcript_5863:385-930(-)
MADEVCAIMSLLAAQGRTVVATIHSPTASAFSLFDDLLMLRDGQLVYAGECGDAAADYFSKRVGLRPLEMGESMPEWLVDAMSPHAVVDDKLLPHKARPRETLGSPQAHIASARPSSAQIGSDRLSSAQLGQLGSARLISPPPPTRRSPLTASEESPMIRCRNFNAYRKSRTQSSGGPGRQ